MDEKINYKELYEKILIECEELKKKLKTYTAPKRNKTFYENHKEELKQKVKEYKEKTGYKSPRTPEQTKEYNKRAYQKRKNKKLLEKENN